MLFLVKSNKLFDKSSKNSSTFNQYGFDIKWAKRGFKCFNDKKRLRRHSFSPKLPRKDSCLRNSGKSLKSKKINFQY